MSGKRGEVQQVFINLMNNAVDAMRKGGGTLTVRLEEETQPGQVWIKVSIQDTGTGIPSDVRDHLFEPFFTTKEPGKGTGLGLSIVQDIVRSYQGLLEVESVLHEGTTFIVRLPAATLKSGAAECSPAARTDRQRKSGGMTPPSLLFDFNVPDRNVRIEFPMRSFPGLFARIFSLSFSA